MDYRKQLFSYKKLHDLDGSDTLFVEAMKKSIDFHRENCPDYNKILLSLEFNSDMLKSVSDLCLIPPIPTLFLKSHQLFSLPENKLIIKSTTSGTGGTVTKVGLDFKTMYYGALMLKKTLSYYKYFSLLPANYIILGYKPSRGNSMGAVKTAFGGTFLAPAIHRGYALQPGKAGYELNIEGVKNTLIRYSKMNLPVRILGFPAYLYFMLKILMESNIKLKLHKKSMIILGGGWKQYSADKVSKTELYKLAEQFLGIPESNFKEIFGVVESNILYCDCPNHHFHIPVYGRVIIRDPKTYKSVKNGEPGLLNLLSPLMGSSPLLSIITDDIAVLHDGKTCGCGISAPYFQVLGRAGDLKTCALQAEGLLKGGRL